MSTFTLLAVFAHPDDEAFGTGGTLAKYAAEGCDVYLVTATSGEAGQIALPALAIPANLPAVVSASCAAPARPTASTPPSSWTTWTANCPSSTRARLWVSWSP